MPTESINKLIARYHTHQVSERNHQSLLNKIVSKMTQLGIAPNPIHYTIIYEAIEQIDPLLGKEIEEAIDSGTYDEYKGHYFFKTLLLDYFGQHLPSSKVESLLNTLLEQLEQWSQSSQENYDTVIHGIHTLEEEDIPTTVKNTLFNEIVPAIKTLLKNTNKLQQDTTNASGELNKLKQDLKQANQMAKTDFLTNIPNRRGLFETAENLINQSKEHKLDFSLVLIDIDFFKFINDQYGHLIGDSVLRFLAKLFEKETKGKDYVARLGGEEFVILLTDTNLENATLFADNLREKIQQTSLKVKNRTDKLELTISCGVSSYHEDEHIENLIERADEALYKAKNNGRNNVKTEQDL